MHFQRAEYRTPHLVWVYPASPASTLDAATWLEMTRELRHMGWRVTLIAPGDNAYGTQYIQGVEVWCLPRLQAYFMKHLTFNVQVLLLLVRRWKTIDYILCHQMSFPWLLPLRMLRLLGGGKRPLLLMDTRDLYLPGPSLKNWVRVAFEHSIHTLANQWADGQTAITQRMAELVGIPERQIWGIWPSGVKRERFVPAQRARRWPQEAEPIRLIYIGILLHQRKLLELCQAVEQANAHGMMFQVFLLGNGSARADLEQFAATTEGRIRVVPAVPYDQIPAWLSQAHIGITSLFPPEQTISQASSPIKLFEYMAAGLPILSTEIVCHTDVVGNENYAFWAKDADVESLLEALQTIWQSRQALEQMGHTAAQAADEWTWQAAARKLRAALEYGATQ